MDRLQLYPASNLEMQFPASAEFRLKTVGVWKCRVEIVSPDTFILLQLINFQDLCLDSLVTHLSRICSRDLPVGFKYIPMIILIINETNDILCIFKDLVLGTMPML